ncbi:MAG TPA: LCP family protein, partial [Candidatus Methylomirabilis sp.]|nr:LCP family protein [Candidatus Methylomirabilis sp.]
MIEQEPKNISPQYSQLNAETGKNKPGKRKIFWKIFSFAVIFVILFLTLFASCANISDQANSFMDKIPFIGQIRHLVNSSDRQLKSEETGRINILFLGMGGKGHDGPYLTDTIMLASFDVTNKKIALLSIPRDLSIPVEGQTDWTKINNINAYAEAKDPDSGGLAVSQAVSDILDIPVDYYVRADFDGFKNIIDEIGGVDVYVENTLDDYDYPIDGQEDNPDYNARFMHLHVDKGWQHMDGDLALKFARSRHAAGAEGSDFARARRQQLILEATKDKMLQAGTLLNPTTIIGVINELSAHISTNLQPWEIIKLWGEFKDVPKASIISKVLDNSPEGLLYQTINDQGAYVLLPKNGDFTEIKYLAANIFNEAPPVQKETVTEEKST